MDPFEKLPPIQSSSKPTLRDPNGAQRIKELEAEVGKGEYGSAYSFGYADGERKGRTTQLQIQLGIITERDRYRKALGELREMVDPEPDPACVIDEALTPTHP